MNRNMVRESEIIERKKILTQLKECIISLVAMLNKRRGAYQEN